MVKKIRIVFFGENDSIFSRLHYMVLEHHPKVEVLLWVASKWKRGGTRAAFFSFWEFRNRFLTRLNLEWNVLTRFGKSLLFFKLKCKTVVTSKERYEDLRRQIEDLSPDMILSAGFDRILPASIINIPPLGAFNCHPSFLPAYAGCDPWFWVLVNGEISSAVTIHQMTSTVDAGNIVGQQQFRISSFRDYQAFYDFSSMQSALLLRNCLKAWSFRKSDQIPQDLSKRTCFPKPTESDYRIDWGWKSRQIQNLVLASNPSPGAWTLINGHKIVVKTITLSSKINAKAGTLVQKDNKGLLIACSDGGIYITAGIFDGEKKSGIALSRLLNVESGVVLK